MNFNHSPLCFILQHEGFINQFLEVTYNVSGSKGLDFKFVILKNITVPFSIGAEYNHTIVARESNSGTDTEVLKLFLLNFRYRFFESYVTPFITARLGLANNTLPAYKEVVHVDFNANTKEVDSSLNSGFAYSPELGIYRGI